jgi:hypothetical protein
MILLYYILVVTVEAAYELSSHIPTSSTSAAHQELTISGKLVAQLHPQATEPYL